MYDIENKLLPILSIEKGLIIGCNEVFIEQTGHKASNIVGRPLQEILSIRTQSEQVNSSYCDFFKAVNATESGVYASATINNVFHYGMPAKVHCVREAGTVDKHKLCFRIIENRSIDPITSLPNGWAIHSRSDHLLTRSEFIKNNFVLVFFNVDNFSTINFRYGFDTGDIYLFTLAKRIQELVGSGNIVARFNNAKFGILIQNQKELPHEAFRTYLKELCKSLCRLSEQPLRLVNGKSVSKSFSIGVSEQSVRYNSFHAMEIAAETAMLEAKRYSSSRYSFSTSKSTVDMLSHKLIIDALPSAIESNKINVHYQPQYELSNDQLIGFEALSRWTHDVLGPIAPDVFVAVAEEIGLNFEFDLWVVYQVCSQIVEWNSKGYSTPKIAINISLKSIEMTSFVSRLNVIIRQTGCPRDRIELEVTETASARNLHTLKDNILQVKALGISLAIDDFGAGYSSLSLIKEYQASLDVLKLDRSLISNICHADLDREFIKQIITLGEVLDVKILAEGVEDKEQKELLKSIGCDYAQGYYFDKPLTSEDAEHLIKNKSKLIQQACNSCGE